MNVLDPIGSIMSTNILTLHPKDKIKQAEDLFSTYDIHHIPIVVMRKLVGIVSMGDMLFLTKKPIMHSFDKYIRDKKLSLDAVEEIMTPDVVCVEADMTIKDAIQFMLLRRVNALPIVEDGLLIGLVTTYDILKKISEQL